LWSRIHTACRASSRNSGSDEIIEKVIFSHLGYKGGPPKAVSRSHTAAYPDAVALKLLFNTPWFSLDDLSSELFLGIEQYPRELAVSDQPPLGGGDSVLPRDFITKAEHFAKLSLGPKGLYADYAGAARTSKFGRLSSGEQRGIFKITQILRVIEKMRRSV